MYYREQTIPSFDGTPLYVRESGDTDKPLLLLIHGGSTDADFYVNCGEAMSRSFHVVAYDRRGHVRSGLTANTKTPGEATKADKEYLKDICAVHVNDAKFLIEYFSNEVDKALGAYVIAHSLGGPIGMDLITQHPQLVRVQIVLGDLRVLLDRELPGEAAQPHELLPGVCPLEDDLRGGVAVGGIVQLVLHDFEKPHGLRAHRVIVLAGGVEIQHLPVHHLFRGADIPNAVKELFPVVPAAVAF